MNDSRDMLEKVTSTKKKNGIYRTKYHPIHYMYMFLSTRPHSETCGALLQARSDGSISLFPELGSSQPMNNLTTNGLACGLVSFTSNTDVISFC